MLLGPEPDPVLRLPGQQVAGPQVADRPAARRPVAGSAATGSAAASSRPAPAAVAARRAAGAHTVAQPDGPDRDCRRPACAPVLSARRL